MVYIRRAVLASAGLVPRRSFSPDLSPLDRLATTLDEGLWVCLVAKSLPGYSLHVSKFANMYNIL